MQIIILPQRGHALLIGPGIFEVLEELLTIRLTDCLICLSVHTQQSFKVCLMAILGFPFDCMHKRNILFSQLGVSRFPVCLIILISFEYKSFDPTRDPGEGWFAFDNLCCDALYSKLIKFVC